MKRRQSAAVSLLLKTGCREIMKTTGIGNGLQVTACINKEFSAIRKEKKEGEKTTQKTTQKTNQKTTQKTKDRILQMMREQPEISQEQIADNAGITIEGVKYYIRNLKKEGKIERVGSDKGGIWKVND